MTVYNPNIPQPNDDPTASQNDLLQNFGKLNTDWAVNHVALTLGGNNGLHTKVQFANVLNSDPTVTGLQSCVYPKLGPDFRPALFFNNALNVYQLTNLPVVNSATDYGIVTPFGFTINAGSIASGVTTVTFAVPFTNGQIYTAELTQSSMTVPPTLNEYAIIGFTTSMGAITAMTISSTSSTTFYYLVIGT